MHDNAGFKLEENEKPELPKNHPNFSLRNTENMLEVNLFLKLNNILFRDSLKI